MKKTFAISILILLVNLTSGQIALGKDSVFGNSTLLDFNNVSGNTKGIILPAVNNVNDALASIPSNNHGTFVFDKSENKVKMYENGTWKDLSNAGSSSQIITNSSSEISSLQGTIIGSNTSNAKGILVLESTNKAVTLPQIANPHLNVINPYPGMMCYDTTSKSLAVYDGSTWNYWK
ncbi:hypothetical protein NZ698_10095 [Chryseobacterium sp. PBS4-4]|uniref:Uncharacterized protein n=1 Tax=Chryseobacterium edaphi TaxID=2976532 RepID=A0ABT2W5S4_9FLAO|nr:hypothetical protein [Chryseobacterium edaphi]MCU7617548.1 hypothetical protein [Chryseobacterium edaphi]